MLLHRAEQLTQVYRFTVAGRTFRFRRARSQLYDHRKRTALGNLQRPTLSVHPAPGAGCPQRRRYLAGCLPQNSYPYRHTAYARSVDELDLPDHPQRDCRLLSIAATDRVSGSVAESTERAAGDFFLGREVARAARACEDQRATAQLLPVSVRS